MMMKACTQTATRNHLASQSCCNASICNLTLLFLVLLLSASYLTENAMCTAEVSHDVTAFSGSPLCLFGQLERGLYYQKISPWNVFLNVCGFRRIFFSMTTRRCHGERQKRNSVVFVTCTSEKPCVHV